jgi:hypothetical protein
LKSKYNYDPGISSGATIERKTPNSFLRLDYNISEDHKLTLRNNFVTGFADNLEWTPTVLTLVIKGTNTIQQLIVSLPN